MRNEATGTLTRLPPNPLLLSWYFHHSSALRLPSCWQHTASALAHAKGHHVCAASLPAQATAFQPPRNFFCGGAVILASGDPLLVGGDKRFGPIQDGRKTLTVRCTLGQARCILRYITVYYYGIILRYSLSCPSVGCCRAPFCRQNGRKTLTVRHGLPTQP